MKTVKTVLAVVVLVVSIMSAPIILLGKISSPDMNGDKLAKINEVFEDVWSERTIFENIDQLPQKNVSQYVQALGLNDSDKVVTGSIMQLGEKQLLRIDVYNSEGLREHVSREELSKISEIYTPMLQTREEYFSPIQENNSQIKASNQHQVGWSLLMGAGIKPSGYEYLSTDNETNIQEYYSPYCLTTINLSLVDAVGKYRDNILSLNLHSNIRADMGIGLGYSKVLLKQKPHSPFIGIDAGLNRLMKYRYSGSNNLGENDGLMIVGKMGALLFRDQKINLFADLAYTVIISERMRHYPGIRFGVVSYWGKKFRKR